MKDPTSSLWRKLAGDMADWDLRTQLLAGIEHGIRVIGWQNAWPSKKADQEKHKKRYPEPIRPPSAKPLEEPKPKVSAAALAEFKKRTEGG